ncbi:hypothetical protein D3C80_2169710 [compost metagenome]
MKRQATEADQIKDDHYAQALYADHHHKPVFAVLQCARNHGVEYKAYGNNAPG